MDRQHVLFVVAHRSVERRLRPSLEQRYEVTVAAIRREALQSIEEEPPDIILVDVPSIRFDVSRFFDSLSDLHVPVITFLLLGKGMRLDQLPRANGYLRHPITTRQLMRRLSRVVPTGPREMVEWHGLYLDTENRLMIWRGQQVPLTPKQASLARVFLTSPETVVSREHLMKEVWGTDYMGDTRTLDVHIHWLRKALAQTEAPFEIETERGVGYRLVRA
ncbi:MAG: winged helix-turn-helix transcriptional regulator [Anaerolineae bacterium]